MLAAFFQQQWGSLVSFMTAARRLTAGMVLGTAVLGATLALYRLIVAESARFPELAAEIYAVGAGRMLATLADYLSWETRNGRLRVADPPLAAEQFVGMLTGRLQLRAVLGVGPTPDEGELKRRANYAVSCFLTIYGPQNRAP